MNEIIQIIIAIISGNIIGYWIGYKRGVNGEPFNILKNKGRLKC